MVSSPMKIKLVHITTVPQTLAFFRGQVGFLKDRGFEISAISSPGGPGDEFSKKEGIPIHPVRMSRGIDLGRDLMAFVRLWLALRRTRPDIVHAHTPKAGLLGVLAARWAGIQVIMLSVFGLAQMTMRGPKKTMMDALTRLSCACAHKVWCDSGSMRDFLVRNKLCFEDKVVVMGEGSVNGVDAEGTFSPARYGADFRAGMRARLGIPERAVVLGFSGRIARDKGMHEMAEAWRMLSAKRQDLHLVLIGSLEDRDPPETQDLRLFESEPRIHLVGFQQDVPSYLAVIDIFVMPSYREGFGLANIEASAMGLPVVSTRIPGCVDSVKDGQTGLLVPPKDAERLAEAIELYLDDPELRRTHGQAGRQRALRDFRPESIWQDLFEEYRALMDNAAGSRRA